MNDFAKCFWTIILSNSMFVFEEASQQSVGFRENQRICVNLPVLGIGVWTSMGQICSHFTEFEKRLFGCPTTTCCTVGQISSSATIDDRFWPMFGVSSVLSTLLLATQPADLQFHDWCSSVGISTPLVKLETTQRSVAGRGVFATDNIQEGDIAITIPEAVAFHEYNAAANFPDLADKLWKCKLKFEKGKAEPQGANPRLWRRLFKRRRQQETFEFADSSDLWQATLTLFSLACLDDKNDHPWKFWISQWQRSDPVQSLFENGVTWRDEKQVISCVDKLSYMLPDVSKTKLRVAVETRLGRLEDMKKIFDLDCNDAEDKKVSRMFGIMTSRALELGDGVPGLLPMFDMLNHSSDPNLALSFDGEKFSLWATRDIAKGEELFVSYKDRCDKTLEWDEDDAVWMLVQWGIALPKPAAETTTTVENDRGKHLAFSG